jgi:hypothetical protein
MCRWKDNIKMDLKKHDRKRGIGFIRKSDRLCEDGNELAGSITQLEYLKK